MHSDAITLGHRIVVLNMSFDIIGFFGRQYPIGKIHELRFIRVNDKKAGVSFSEIDSELVKTYFLESSSKR